MSTVCYDCQFCYCDGNGIDEPEGYFCNDDSDNFFSEDGCCNYVPRDATPNEKLKAEVERLKRQNKTQKETIKKLMGERRKNG